MLLIWSYLGGDHTIGYIRDSFKGSYYMLEWLNILFERNRGLSQFSFAARAFNVVGKVR